MGIDPVPSRARRVALAGALCALVLTNLSATAYADPAPSPVDSSGAVVPAPTPTDPTPTDTATPSPADSPSPSDPGSASGPGAPSDPGTPSGTGTGTQTPSPSPSDSTTTSGGGEGPKTTPEPTSPTGGVRGSVDPSTSVSPSPSPSPTLVVPSPPSDGVAPSAGQVDEYLALTTQHDAALVTLPALRLAVATADAHVSSLTAERAGVDSAIWQIRVTAAVTQGSADDVVRNLYQQGDGGLGAIATVVTAGPEGLITRLDTLQMLNATADGAVDAARVARSDLALALARADALDLSLESARGDVLTAEARLTAAQATVDSLDARLRTLAIVPPQVTVGPDGCPTQDLPATLRDGAELVGAPTLCRAAVKQAATPQAALAISWAFQHLGAAYACGGAGRLLPFRMDCSSFVSRAYHEGAGLATAGDSWAATTRNMVPWDGVPLDPHYGLVAPEALRPGDLVLYDTCPQGGCAYKHVVMYLGSPDGGKTRWMIHTNSCGDVAKIEPFWGFPTTGSRFLVARRVLALPGEKVLVPSPVDARAAAAAAHAAAVTALHVPAV